MAKEQNKNDQTHSVEHRLRSLYELQTILSEIDRIRTIRGELPEEVKDLEDNIEGLHTRIERFKAEIEELRQKSATEKNKILAAKSQIETYNVQLDNVRNNREFDLLTKEVGFQNLEIQLSEKRISQYDREIEAKQADIETANLSLADQTQMLADKRKQLDEIIAETRKDEEQLRVKAKDLEARIDDPRTLNAFKRIRKNARNGLGVVYIQRNACGGCFNRIPPQKQMEIKMHKKIIVCEYCGRIMIDPQLAGIDEAETASK